jgi:hypothetical protein
MLNLVGALVAETDWACGGTAAWELAPTRSVVNRCFMITITQQQVRRVVTLSIWSGDKDVNC